jgi:Domain of unknown function (DUF3471)
MYKYATVLIYLLLLLLKKTVPVFLLLAVIGGAAQCQGEWMFDLRKGGFGYINTTPPDKRNSRPTDADKAIETIIAAVKSSDAPAIRQDEPDGTNPTEGAKPERPLEDYAGIYQNKSYGSIQIFVENSVLKAQFGPDTVQVEHLYYNIFRLTGGRLEEIGETSRLQIRFHTDFDGSVGSLDSQLEPVWPNETIFTKQK